jgi:hypothetical protein
MLITKSILTLSWVVAFVVAFAELVHAFLIVMDLAMDGAGMAVMGMRPKLS